MPIDPPSLPASFLSFEGVRFDYGGAAIVDGVDWTVGRGAVHCLLGRSGCGKTTLLKLAAGLLAPAAGRVRLDGAAVRGPGDAVGFVFQAPTLLEWLTVLDNVLLPVTLHRRATADDRARALDLLERVGLDGLSDRGPRALSGGQQSRVALARALIADPALLLLDEPFAALDALTREELQEDLLRLCAQRGTTALFVTHDIAEAVYLGDRVAVMADGRLHHSLSIDLPRPRPRDLRYDPRFNALCRELRHVMDGAAGLRRAEAAE